MTWANQKLWFVSENNVIYAVNEGAVGCLLKREYAGLVAAAPELYEAVCALLSASPINPQPDAYEKARRAIEKAEGRA